MTKFRRYIDTDSGKKKQPHIIFLTLLFAIVALMLVLWAISAFLTLIKWQLDLKVIWLAFWLSLVIDSFLLIRSYKRREQVTTYQIGNMTKKAQKLSKRLLGLFNDMEVKSVLKLSVKDDYGHKMPLIYVYVQPDLLGGYVAVENIANYSRLKQEDMEQNFSSTFAGKFKKFAVVSSELVQGDSYMIFNFEDVTTSHRLSFSSKKDLEQFVSDDKHALKLQDDLIWHTDETPHLSVIARTRSGKSVFCGDYLAQLMRLQGWVVYYNSAKADKYTIRYKGLSDPTSIVDFAEKAVNSMKKRLAIINRQGKAKYTEIPNMRDVALFFDEIGNLNAALEQDKKLKKRWENAINKLTATGASAGIHVIAISQFATTAGFLPSLAKVNCSDAVIFLGGAANSATERQYLVPGFEMPQRFFDKGQGLAKIDGSGKKWGTLHFFETPWVS